MSSLAFKALLLDISSGLSDKDLESLKYLCGDVIGKRDREKCTTGTQLFQILTERGKLGPDNTGYLCDLLTEVKRLDLCEKLQHFSGDALVHTDKLDDAAEVLSEHLGRWWRKLGRKLGMSEVKLDSISRKHPTDLEETARELLQQWRKSRGEQATAEVLIQALRDCDLNLTADTVEDRLALSDQAVTKL
ncbi:protein FADD [Boleophthalmus pectinirostris]|uniref:protein FADD n=1 Tax=Boleophthalmus pectinirostris TaxID=150288 RepID=UPI000A1C2F9E|nr:protein FADD [Boleophthalmus pectinirostris]